MEISVLVSLCPVYVKSYEEWQGVAFLAHVLMSTDDLERFGATLDEWGFSQVPQEVILGEIQEEIPDPPEEAR